MADEAGEKTLDPTPLRREQLRASGHVALSHELTSAAVLLGGIAVLAWLGTTLVEHLMTLLRGQLGGHAWQNWLGADEQGTRQLAARQWTDLAQGLAQVLLPGLALVAVVGAMVSLVQTRFLFLPRRAMGDLSRVNPLNGFARLFSWQSARRLAVGLVKLLVIAAIATAAVYPRRDELASLTSLELPAMATLAWRLCLDTCLKVSLAIALLAVCDYAYQRWKFERQARMTPQELREEMRSLQGDPQSLARRRGLHRQMIESQGVRRADVVVAAPGGVAVALRYDAGTMRAPVVVGKSPGTSQVAWRQWAAVRQIPWLERGPLAERLHSRGVVNGPIGDELYAEVAEVLAIAYQVRGARTSA